MTTDALHLSGTRQFTSRTGSATAQDWMPTFLMVSSGSAALPDELAKAWKLSALETDWDGRGGVPPSLQTAKNVESWLGPMRDAASRTGKAWRRPHVSASGDGEIAFEWWHESRKITLYFGDDGAEYLKVWGAHIEDEMDSGDLLTPDTFRALWAWLYA